MPDNPELKRVYAGGVPVWDANEWFPTMSGGAVRFYERDLSQITGIALHHDAVAFEEGDRNFDGSTVDEERARMQASYNWHTKFFPGRTPDSRRGWDWPGMGYHLYAFPSGRVYQVGYLDTVRAHVAHRNTPLAGIVIAGDWSVERPPAGSILSLGCAVAWTWARTGRIILADGHRVWAVPGWETSCPGHVFNAWIPQVVRCAAAILQREQNRDANIKVRAALTPAWEQARWADMHRQLHYIRV